MLNCQLISLFKKKRTPQKLLMEPDRCRKPLQSFLYCLCSLSAVEPQVTLTLTHGVMRTGPAHQPAARAFHAPSCPVMSEITEACQSPFRCFVPRRRRLASPDLRVRRAGRRAPAGHSGGDGECWRLWPLPCTHHDAARR